MTLGKSDGLVKVELDMVTLDSSKAVALTLMLQAERTAGTDTGAAPASDLVSTLAGKSSKSIVAVERQPSQAQSNVTDASLRLIAEKENERKVQLVKAFGQAFGVNQDDFPSNFDYVQAVGHEIDRISAPPNGQDAVNAITKKLGLDKLGLSTDDMLNAILLPSSDNGKRLDAAVAKEFDEAGKEKLSKLQHTSEKLSSVQDENGVYKPVIAASKAKADKGQDGTDQSAD